MGPPLPDHRKDDSSESDEEGNVRHDRFRSERFQEARTEKSRIREDNSIHGARNSSRRHRDRSPLRPHRSKHKRTSSPISSHRSESRNSYERRDRDREIHKKCKKERSAHNEKGSDVKSEKDNDTKINKNKLSCLLKNFDKQLESKRNILENESDIGPALPPHLRQENKDVTESKADSPTEPEAAMDPKLLSHIKAMPESANENSNDSGSDSNLKAIEAGNNKISDNKNESEDAVTEGPILPQNTLKPQIPVEDSLEETKNVLENSLVNNSPSSNSSDTDTNDIATCSEQNSFGPDLPQKIEPNIYGPVLPPKIEFDSYGPALPPNFKKDIIQGPTLPSGMTSDQLEMIALEESDDEGIVGPLPEGKMNMTQFQLDLRAMQIKRKLEEEKNGSTAEIKKREEWMLELPPEKATNLGLGPRSFRVREAPDMSNRSSWTDTPADKLRKEEQALRGESEPVNTEEMMKKAFIKERDEVMDKMSQLSREEDRPDSLLAMHQKKLKKKKKKDEKDGKKKERRPFDRNIDLQVNRFDEAQKKAIFKKAQLLDTRFSTGESKYL